MAFVFNFPDVGEGIHEGRVVEWLVAEGDVVVVDQPLLKVETDKAVVEIPVPEAGTILKINAAAGDTIHVGQALVAIGEPGEDVSDVGGSAAEVAAEQAPATEAAPAMAEVEGLMRPLATPRTRAYARSKGVDLTSVSGSGSRGRITNEDVDRAAAGPVAPLAPTIPATVAPTAVPVSQLAGRVEATKQGEVERVPISHLRTVIADAMRASKHHSAHVTHVDEADVTDLVAAQKSLKAELAEQGVRLTLLPFFIKALVTVLKQYPMFNASVDEETKEIVLKKYYNIGIAVDTPEGLIVPVLKDADQKDMVSIANEVVDLAERARSRQLTLDELRGGSCTITNIGPLGGVFATPIINQPELAIVGLHAIKERPAVVDGEIVIRKQMYLSVSFDHRWIDGAEGARFMSDLVRLVSNPSRMMVRL